MMKTRYDDVEDKPHVQVDRDDGVDRDKCMRMSLIHVRFWEHEFHWGRIGDGGVH